MARVVERNCEEVGTARQALGDFLAINYISGSPDGHSKNLSIRILPGSVSLAPLYDMATGFPYDGRPEYRTVVLSVGGRRQFGQVLAKHRDKAAATLSIPPEAFRARVTRLAGDFPDAFATALEALDTPEAADIRRRTMGRLSAHCADTVAQLTGRH